MPDELCIRQLFVKGLLLRGDPVHSGPVLFGECPLQRSSERQGLRPLLAILISLQAEDVWCPSGRTPVTTPCKKGPCTRRCRRHAGGRGNESHQYQSRYQALLVCRLENTQP